MRLSFGWGAAIEFGLLLLGLGFAWAFAVPAWGGWRWEWRDGGWGVAATIPLLAALGGMLRAENTGLRRIREFLERRLRPALGGWSTVQLLAISVLAGVAEEVLFRAALQGGATRGLGPLPALVLASVLFGVCHWITPAYALITGVMGLYLGALWWWSGNLLTPVVAHALYDFVALLWLLRFRPSTAGGADPASPVPES
jgi:membrane protease YdiL (CAAX protease family)